MDIFDGGRSFMIGVGKGVARQKPTLIFVSRRGFALVHHQNATSQPGNQPGGNSAGQLTSDNYDIEMLRHLLPVRRAPSTRVADAEF